MRSGRRLPGVRPVCRQHRASSRPPFHLRDAANHLENIFEILPLLLAPRAPMQNRVAPSVQPVRQIPYLIYGSSPPGATLRVCAPWRAVGAIFRTSARLNRRAGGRIGRASVMEFPMQLLRLEQEIRKRLPVNPANLFASPGVTHVGLTAVTSVRLSGRRPPEPREFHAQPY